MKSPKDKYSNDNDYRQLVDMLEHFIHKAQFTPSELREASVLACINYEMRRVRSYEHNPEVENAFDLLKNFSSKWQNPR